MFRITIRDVLWLTVVVALMAGWWIDRRQLRQEVFQANESAHAYLLELTRISPPPTPLPNSN